MTGVVFRRSESKGSVCTGRSSDDWRCVLKMRWFIRLGLLMWEGIVGGRAGAC